MKVLATIGSEGLIVESTRDEVAQMLGHAYAFGSEVNRDVNVVGKSFQVSRLYQEAALDRRTFDAIKQDIQKLQKQCERMLSRADEHIQQIKPTEGK